MSALPNPLQTRKAPTQARRPAKLNRYGRDPGSPSERLRASSDYDSEKGYSPFYHAFMADIPRLTSGGSCTLLILALWGKSAGRGAAKGQPRPEWTLGLSVEDLAQICNCDVRTVQRELAALDKRGIAEVKQPAKGEIEARLKYRDWESLPDYKSAVVEMPAAKDEPESDAVADESKPGNQRVTGKKPVRLVAGAVSQVFPVSCGVKSFRYKVEGPVDVDFTCVVQAGEILVVSRFPDDWREKVLKSIATPNVFNDLNSPPRHARRGESEPIPANEGTRNKGNTLVVTHPRAAELSAIFDPFLAASRTTLLSSDPSSLYSACVAIGDCDHDFLVQFAGNRAVNPIKKPAHVKLICTEALTSWKASKVLTGAGLGKPDVASKEEIAALIAKEREARLGKKR